MLVGQLARRSASSSSRRRRLSSNKITSSAASCRYNSSLHRRSATSRPTTTSYWAAAASLHYFLTLFWRPAPLLLATISSSTTAAFTTASASCGLFSPSFNSSLPYRSSRSTASPRLLHAQTAATSRMSVSSYEYSNFRVWTHGKAEAIKKCFLPLKDTTHKGSSGRIVVLGGSARYTGAPYYAAMACLRTGADLVTVCTAHEASMPLKCYSPELMVQTVYRAADFDRLARNDPTVTPDQAADWMRDMVDSVMECCERAHCLILGPGLGRCPAVMKAVAEIIWRARGQNMYMVLDADALFLLAQREYRNLLQGYDKAVLTPNIMEYRRLHQLEADADDDDLESVVIVQKGHEDHIRVNDTTLLTCAEVGGLKRSGGIGDVLSGVLGTMVSWHKILVEGHTETVATTIDLPLTCWTACCLVKLATRRAFLSKRRAMSATDVLNELGTSLDEMESVWV